MRLLLENDPNHRVLAVAGSPDGLLDAVARHPCDVIVTDFNMPGHHGDGFQLLSALRRREPALPVVVLTMIANASMLRSILDIGIEGLVSKLDAVSHLPLAVNAVAHRKRYVSPTVLSRLQSTDDTPVAKLTPNEATVLRKLATGMTVTEIAQALNRSVKTISGHKVDGMAKLGIQSDVELFAYVRKHRLIP